MSRVSYSAAQQDLYYPAKDLTHYSTERPKSDAELCAWMSLLAYCDMGTSFAFDQVKIAAKLAPLGFRPVKFAESKDQAKKGGTHGLVAVHDDAVEANKLAIVAFRGTNKDDPRDVVDDLEPQLVAWRGPGKVFEGFKDAFEEVVDDLLPAVQSINYKLLFTGHSLGAALATLLAAVQKPSALYTIGSPRAGDQEFVAALSAVNNSRYVDCCDVVTTLPPPQFGHVHLGNPLYIDRQRKVIPNPGDDFIASDRLRAGLAYFFRYAWRPGDVRVRFLADHAPINYATAIAASQTSALS